MDRRAECWNRRLKKRQALGDKVEKNDLVLKDEEQEQGNEYILLT